nr:hypothetical protein [Angustibacter aerolatus]
MTVLVRPARPGDAAGVQVLAAATATSLRAGRRRVRPRVAGAAGRPGGAAAGGRPGRGRRGVPAGLRAPDLLRERAGLLDRGASRSTSGTSGEAPAGR